MGNISELERRISIRIILEDAEIIFALLSSEQDIRVYIKGTSQILKADTLLIC